MIDQFFAHAAKAAREIRKLNEALDQARASLAIIGRGVGLGAAVTQTEGLATAWGNVAKNAAAAQRAIGANNFNVKRRMSLAGTTTVFAVALASFNTSTMAS